MRIAIKTEPNEEKLQYICDSGCKDVEVYLARRFVQPKYTAMLKNFPLKYSTHAPVQYCDESIFDFARAVGSDTITVHCTYTYSELEDIVLRAASLGIFLCMENEGVWGEDNYEHDLKKPPELLTIHTGEDFLKLKESLPDLYMTLDTEHAQMRGSLDSFWPIVQSGEVKHVHTSGYSGDRGSWHSPPMNNQEKFGEHIRKLKELGHQGMLTAEMHTKLQTKEEFDRTVAFFNSCQN